MAIVLVVDGDVVDRFFQIFVHPLHAVEDDRRRLVGKRRIVRTHRGKRQRVEQALPVLMLQPLAGQRRAAGGAADHEAFGPTIARGPHQVADALEAEHRVVNEERNHVDSMRRIRRAGGDERRHRARLGDPLFEQLAVFGFAIVSATCPESTGS